MKKLLLTLMVMAALTMLYTACENEAELAPQSAPAAEKLSPEILVSNYLTIETPVVAEPDLLADYTLIDDGLADEELPVSFNESSGTLSCHQPFKDSLYYFLTQLNLTKEQSKKIHYALQEFHRCKMHQYAMLRKINHEILAKANKEKQEIILKLKNHEITKEQAEKALKELKAKLEFIFKNDPARKKVLDNLYKCHQELFENIRLILNKEQWEQLIIFLKNRKF